MWEKPLVADQGGLLSASNFEKQPIASTCGIYKAGGRSAQSQLDIGREKGSAEEGNPGYQRAEDATCREHSCGLGPEDEVI